LDLCGLIYDAGDMGRLSIDGQAATPEQLAAILGDDIRVVRRLLLELEVAAVFDRTEEGFIQSRRILREEVRQKSARSFGKLGGNPALKSKDKAPTSLKPRGKSTESRASYASRERTPDFIGRVKGALGPAVANPDRCGIPAIPEFWIREGASEEHIIETLKRCTTAPRAKPIRNLSALTDEILGPQNPGPRTKPETAHPPAEPMAIPEGDAGACLTAIVEGTGEVWARQWLGKAEWNGSEVFVGSQMEADRIRVRVGKVLKLHGYTVAVRGAP